MHKNLHKKVLDYMATKSRNKFTDIIFNHDHEYIVYDLLNQYGFQKVDLNELKKESGSEDTPDIFCEKNSKKFIVEVFKSSDGEKIKRKPGSSSCNVWNEIDNIDFITRISARIKQKKNKYKEYNYPLIIAIPLTSNRQSEKVEESLNGIKSLTFNLSENKFENSRQFLFNIGLPLEENSNILGCLTVYPEVIEKYDKPEICTTSFYEPNILTASFFANKGSIYKEELKVFESFIVNVKKDSFIRCGLVYKKILNLFFPPDLSNY